MVRLSIHEGQLCLETLVTHSQPQSQQSGLQRQPAARGCWWEVEVTGRQAQGQWEGLRGWQRGSRWRHSSGAGIKRKWQIKQWGTQFLKDNPGEGGQKEKERKKGTDVLGHIFLLFTAWWQSGHGFSRPLPPWVFHLPLWHRVSTFTARQGLYRAARRSLSRRVTAGRTPSVCESYGEKKWLSASCLICRALCVCLVTHVSARVHIFAIFPFALDWSLCIFDFQVDL